MGGGFGVEVVAHFIQARYRTSNGLQCAGN
jgi:hypothetical protein